MWDYWPPDYHMQVHRLSHDVGSHSRQWQWETHTTFRAEPKTPWNAAATTVEGWPVTRGSLQSRQNIGRSLAGFWFSLLGVLFCWFFRMGLFPRGRMPALKLGQKVPHCGAQRVELVTTQNHDLNIRSEGIGIYVLCILWFGLKLSPRCRVGWVESEALGSRQSGSKPSPTAILLGRSLNFSMPCHPYLQNDNDNNSIVPSSPGYCERWMTKLL